ncbi:RING/FYVE/PHD zinc finger protein, putative [Medicago truncatula]|uniref:RING/FYVE/PHD zinc finger protein, putative n=1 Tax=Medicago truncatula TaxID=3880 RepID=G7KNE7_MEDTR|nr:RING/FYVE/PHD zinc finger protein, putative [Medicago truncatula]
MTFYLTCQFQIHINEVRVCGGFNNGNHCIAEENFEAGNHCVVDAFSKENNDVCPIFGFGCDIVLCDWCLSSLNHGCLGLNRVLDGDWFFRICCCKICYRPK